MGTAQNLRNLFVLLATVTSVSCSSNKQENKKWDLITDDLKEAIFSNRPQNIKQVILMLKLETQPLLKNATVKDGKRSVNAEQAQQIESEQTKLVESLKKISADIKVLFKYRMVLNAVSVLVPAEFADQVKSLPGIMGSEKAQIFSRPIVNQAESTNIEKLGKLNSVSFIGADLVHSRGLKGQGQKIGIIDTGIDYTHAMFGGKGTEEAYKSVDPTKANEMFPNQKVVNGIDLVGTSFDGSSEVILERIPKPDVNPLDEAGHGTHVAGTVAGLGDEENTYSGVAPDASLYAIKVFGANGSTTDEVVIAAMEWAADPNLDLELNDQLDVVNLSLGSEYGTSHLLYSEAIESLSHGGTVVVASAGNSGPQTNIVGSPSASEAAISVAASVDGMEHNWKFAAVRLEFENSESVLAEVVEGPSSKSVAEAGDVKGSVVYVGLANEDFAPEMLEKIKGKVALIDRGGKFFSEKLNRVAKAGAIGALMANNQEGAAFAMGLGGDDKPVDIPAIMIVKSIGEKLKQELGNGKQVQIFFKTNEKIEKPELIDSIAGFSSQGPRFEDALIKPEISSPGDNVISAAMGAGKKSIKLSGTSMAAPHIAGVVALLKQSHPEMNSHEIKSILMGTAKTIADEKKANYSVSRMGAGRVQVERASRSAIVSSTTALSLGVMRIEDQKVLRRPVVLKNISSSDLKLNVVFEGSSQFAIADQAVEIKAASSQTVMLEIKISAKDMKEGPNEINGIVQFKSGDSEIFRIPMLAIVNQVSQVHGHSLVVRSTSALDAAGSTGTLVLKNSSKQAGTALPFNLIGVDGRKTDANQNPLISKACDLQASGYRIVNGKLQIAIKLYESVSTWHLCEVSVLIDANGDNMPDQEIVGAPADRLQGAQGKEFKTLLLDANKARDIRKKFEVELEASQNGGGTRPENPGYTDALIGLDDMKIYNSSSIAMVQMDVAALKLRATGEFALKIATSAQEDMNAETDDFLGAKDKWINLDIRSQAQSFLNFPEVISVGTGADAAISLDKGEGSSPLLLLFPQNRSARGVMIGDEQLQIIEANYKP